MKKYKKTLFIIVSLVLLTFFYFKNNVSYNFNTDGLVFFNPLGIDENEFEKKYAKAVQFLSSGDTLKAKKYFHEALNYRGSYNEKIKESLFSCGNGLWRHKQDNLTKYSICFFQLGSIDSAMVCLEPALYNVERHSFSTEKQFFSLVKEKYGNEELKKELRRATSRIYEIDCFMCSNYYIEVYGIKIGLDRSDQKLKKEQLFHKLKNKYIS